MKTILRKRVRFGLIAVLGLAAALGVIALMARADGPAPASASHDALHVDANGNPLPHATYKIWDLNFQDPLAVPPDPLFGFDPNMTVSDKDGKTVHVAAGDPLAVDDPLNFTNVTVMENTFCSGLPCGVTYWNPATNNFKCYGYSGGSMTGVDVNVSAPLKFAPPGTLPPPAGSYGPGDTWLAKSGSFSTVSAPGRPLTVQFPGSDLFRSWGAGNMSSVAVDQVTGLIWFTDQDGFIGVFDPATNGLKRWNVGGTPRDIVPVPGTGLAYATVGPSGAVGDEIIEVDRITNGVRRWAVPAVGHLPPSLQGFFNAFQENPNGISVDSAGLVWFSESISDEIASLDPATNTFTEYLKVDPVTGANAINEPQNVAASGAGANQQTFFSEGAGNATGIVTPDEAAGTVQEVITVVLPVIPAIDPTEDTLTPEDHEHDPSQKDIPPTIHDSPGEDGVPWTDPGPTTGAGEVIPGILRFPFPAPFQRAVGMTEVLIPNTVFGSLIGPPTFPFPIPEDEHVFEMTSGAIIAEPEGEEGGRMTGGGSIWLADVNNDSVSDIADIALVAGSFGQAVPPAPVQLDVAPSPPDGLVDIIDIASIAAFFGQSKPPKGNIGIGSPPGSMRVTHGFVLQCDASQVPNNLQVNWLGNRFHLENLDTATCSDDPDIDERPPPAGFDTHVGSGTGRYNGVPGATAEWTFTDAGEPGKNDQATITIKDADGNTVLAVSGNLNRGNHQAHKAKTPGADATASAPDLGSEWVLTESGFEPAFATIDNSDPTIELCSLP